MNRLLYKIGSLIVIIFYIIFYLTALYAIKENKKRVIVTGDNVKSRLVEIKNGKKNYVTEITGHPKIKFGDKELQAKRIVIRGFEGEIVEGIGNVVVIDKKSSSIIRSKRAIYYKLRDEVEIIGNPSIVTRRNDDNSVVYLDAEGVIYDIDKDIANVSGKVYLRNRETKIRSQRLVLERQKKKMIFSGNPIMQRGEDIFRASEIIYPIDKKALFLNGNAHVVTFSNKRDTKKGESKRTKLIAKGDRIEHYEDGEGLTIIMGNAIIEGDDAIFRGDRIEIIGEKPSLVIGTAVSIDYLPENVELYGENYKYYPKKRYSALWGDALIVIEDEKTHRRNTRIYGSFMEYFQDIDELIVSGNVKVFHDSEIIKGDMARYQRKDNNMIITGNSRVEKGSSIISADTIIYNTKSHDTRLTGDIRGFIVTTQ